MVYALSTDLKKGIVTPIHMWRMSKGEMVLDENGNVSLTFTTYNGTTVTATAVYDFSPAATGVEDVVGGATTIRKELREGRLLIIKDGQVYDVMGNRL